MPTRAVRWFRARPRPSPGLKFTNVFGAGGGVSLQLREFVAGHPYEIYWKPRVDSALAWAKVIEGHPGQTNFSVPGYDLKSGFWLAASGVDSDGDGLSDGAEALVTKTDRLRFDTDGDGLGDAEEDHNANGIPDAVDAERHLRITAYASRPLAVEGGPPGEIMLLLPEPAPAGGVVVQYHVGGSATAGTEFTLTPSGSAISIPAGARQAAISVAAVNDTQPATYPLEVTLGLTNASRFTVDGRQAVVQLRDNDPPVVSVIATVPRAKEPAANPGSVAGPGELTFVRSGATSNSLVLQFTVSGSAVAGTDTYEIYAHVAEARSRALGAAEEGRFLVRGEVGVPVNLVAAPFSLGPDQWEHSGQFNSTQARRGPIWRQVLLSTGLASSRP